MNLQALDQRSDCKIYAYDLVKHDWPAFWLQVAQERFPEITFLETVHKELTPVQISELGKHCQEYSGSQEFARRVDDYYGEMVSHLGLDEWMIQRYFTIRIVIPNQAKVGRQLSFHQGIWVGNGLGLRTIWTPFTKAYDTNTMWMVDWERSKEITQNTYTHQWSSDTIQEKCTEHAFPVELSPGEAVIFQQAHLHGNYNNTTDITRWSMDGRILPKGGHYHRKMPGAYFRFVGGGKDTRKVNKNNKWISYAGWSSRFSSPIPLPMQRAIIEKYCDSNHIRINDYQFENEYLHWQPSLEKFIKDYNIDGIVLCSIYSLPDNPCRRFEILKTAVENKVELHFANELCSVRNAVDIDHIQKIFEYVNENTDPNETLGLSL